MKRVHWIAVGVVAAASVAMAAVGDPHHFPAFYLLFGLAGSLGFSVVAKFVLKKLLMREEGYYDER